MIVDRLGAGVWVCSESLPQVARAAELQPQSFINGRRFHRNMPG